ncbi:hypothetical protein [Rheinheimera pacifica]|uniref:hypothetical protein n=1 Tax=Rheinheimera pacifica TaxID=173990 RepID=UPI002EDB140D
MKLSSIFVYVLTILWLILGGYYIYHTWPAVMELQPNEIGDSLAGFFAPLAFFWLVAGYIQQGKELQQNTEALRLQHEELKNSVEQQKIIASSAKAEMALLSEDYSAQRKKELVAAQPKFELAYLFDRGSEIGGRKKCYKIKLLNIGHAVTDLKLYHVREKGLLQVSDDLLLAQFQVFETGKNWEREFDKPISETEFTILATYNDGLRNRESTSFYIEPHDDKWRVVIDDSLNCTS